MNRRRDILEAISKRRIESISEKQSGGNGNKEWNRIQLVRINWSLIKLGMQ
jgi:hypothetical protein